MVIYRLTFKLTWKVFTRKEQTVLDTIELNVIFRKKGIFFQNYT